MKFDNRVQRSSHLLTKMDKKIIEYIKTHELDDNFSTINSLAYAIGTSPATITRFSSKLNYNNFQDMKFSLQHEKSEKVVENAPLVQLIHSYHQNIIQQTGEFISEEKIKRLAHNLKTCRQVNFAGLGSSGLTASEFYYRTMRMGVKGSISTDAHQMKISASLLSSKDMFVAISNSGETSELIEASNIAQIRGAYVVVITNFEGSALTKNADLVLITSARSSNNDSRFINSQIATHFLIDLVSYILLGDPNMHRTYQQTRQVVLNNEKE
ncbi:MurR/RpiR family transcriptional regulator [Staphylococcus pragensis]|uniref:MurR/RpiR family transcriptional regulator n=1 Tax=Staphylococcus pragensis TaxID=1611836 RepID=A0A4Z1BWZ6_9STAP|nr:MULTISPECIES: MurR/RpiR family transcriptional regulator [Staphylococcus]RTX91896.1 MurR/RpiR family transcriptional regulator [Staphylococcus carnosus]TGN27025.1 MurR/RpiR family transcriptional regulator [Staphylococcus pragensis]GGG94668.1 RpiR family transcriptional regulator [Staphylococcus pragensis]